MSPSLAAGRRGGLVTMPGHNAGQRPPNYGRRFPAEPLTRDEIAAIMGAFSRRGSAGIRNAALTALLYRSGVRINEALSAPLGDLSLDEGTFFVRFPKRDRRGRSRPRKVAFDPEAAAMLERWLTRRRMLLIPRTAPLFCQIQGERRGWPMGSSGYREALKAAAARAGVERRVHPHAFRHTFAYQWLEEGKRLDLLQAALGHLDLKTTSRYAMHVHPKDMLDAMRDRHWAAPAQPAAAPELVDAVLVALRQLGVAA